MDNKSMTDQLADHVIRKVQNCYLRGEINRTNDCSDDMIRDGLREADVEKVIMNASVIEKVMPATSQRASSQSNTHYVIHGKSIDGRQIYCKICSNYHPVTGNFIDWRLTSFCLK